MGTLVASSKKNERLWLIVAVAGLAAVNLPVLLHYLGRSAAAIYAVCFALLALLMGLRILSPRWAERLALAGVVASLAVQLLALHRLSPAFESRMDRNEAIIYWLSALARGDNPYAVPTDLGNPISVFPFVPLFASPFVLAGNVGYLEIFGYLLLVVLLWHRYRGAPMQRAFSVLVLSSAPLIFFEVTARSDIIANMALLMLIPWYLMWVEDHRESMERRDIVITGVLFGCLAATRIALLPALAVPALYLLRRHGAGAFARVMGLAAVLVVALLLPFILWDPDLFFGYAPLGVNRTKLGQHAPVQAVWLIATGLVTLASGFLVRCAKQLFIWLLPILVVTVAATWLTFAVDLSYLQIVFVPLLFSLEYPLTSCGGNR
jgi:hypothetical protein